MYFKRFKNFLPLLSPDGGGGGGDPQPDPEPQQDFDSATVELMELLASGGNGSDAGDQPAIETPATQEGGTRDIDIPEEIETLDIPVGSEANDYHGMKEDLLEEIKKLIPQEVPGAPETDPLQDTPPLEDEFGSEEFMNKYMENPIEAVTELANKIADQKVANQMEALKQQLAPVMQQAQEVERQNAIRKVLTEFMTNPDFADAGEFNGDIVKHINENGLPKDDINSYKEAYWRAKTNSLQNSQGKSLEDYLGDEEAVNQITSNDAIKQKVIADYLKSIAEGSKPVTLGGDSYSPTATPAISLNSLDDAGAALIKNL